MRCTPAHCSQRVCPAPLVVIAAGAHSYRAPHSLRSFGAPCSHPGPRRDPHGPAHRLQARRDGRTSASSHHAGNDVQGSLLPLVSRVDGGTSRALPFRPRLGPGYSRRPARPRNPAALSRAGSGDKRQAARERHLGRCLQPRPRPGHALLFVPGPLVPSQARARLQAHGPAQRHTVGDAHAYGTVGEPCRPPKLAGAGAGAGRERRCWEDGGVYSLGSGLAAIRQAAE